MSSFEVLCVTMHQNDFSKIDQMHIDSDVVFANQSDSFDYNEYLFSNHTAKMITTNTRGVGNNRNIAMLFASGDICLLADDDMAYEHGYEKTIIDEFSRHLDADIIIFNIGTNTPEYGRIPTQIRKFKRLYPWSKNPFGAPRIAFRRESVQKANIQFSTLFGGGAVYRFGEDSVWLKQMMRKGMKIYLSPHKIGDVSYSNSTWFTQDYREICYSRGASLEASDKRTALLLAFIYSVREKMKGFPFFGSLKWHIAGIRSYKTPEAFCDFCKTED